MAALAGCAAQTPPPKAPFKTKVDGWVEKGHLVVAVADERPIAVHSDRPKEVDQALEVEEKYGIAE